MLDAYASFSPELADTARRFFDGWIDAPARPGKRPGAFCAYTVPSHHPYVLLNWTSRRRDVLTLAHELGHGAHAYLARPQGVFHQTTPLTLAETASVFGETVTFGRLLDVIDDPQERLALLASNLEDQIATVFRQTAMNRFEDAIHTARRDEGELSVERIGELWAQTQTDDARRRGRAHRGLPHVVVVHPALHRHARLRVRVRVRAAARAVGVRALRGAGAPTSCPRYLDLLRAGGSMPPEELGRIVGVDLADPEFWDRGLDIVERRLEETEQAARATPAASEPVASGRDLPSDPVVDRQRRAPRRAPRSRAIPSSSSSGCGCTAPTRPARTRASSSASSTLGVAATNDADALLAIDADCVCYTATADLRPTEAIADMARIAASGKNIVSSSVVPLVFPAARRARDAPAARRRRARAPACRASRRASTPAGRTTCCRSCSPARASTSRRCA